MKNKKGVVTFSLFSLILLLFILLLGFSYYLYSDEKAKFSQVLLEKEIIITKINVFDSMTKAYSNENVSIYFTNLVEPQSISIETTTTSVYILNKKDDENIVEKTYSLEGMRFCSDYSFLAAQNKTFVFDGTCISVS